MYVSPIFAVQRDLDECFSASSERISKFPVEVDGKGMKVLLEDEMMYNCIILTVK